MKPSKKEKTNVGKAEKPSTSPQYGDFIARQSFAIPQSTKIQSPSTSSSTRILDDIACKNRSIIQTIVGKAEKASTSSSTRILDEISFEHRSINQTIVGKAGKPSTSPQYGDILLPDKVSRFHNQQRFSHHQLRLRIIHVEFDQ